VADLVKAELETRRLVLELASERERQGLSQERVAAALGTKEPNVARLERGGVDPKQSSLVRYASLLGRRISLEPLQPEASPRARHRPSRSVRETDT
jgi:transcriptional regulator with XRE-family HTH domain